jgi:hypothetical protein
VGAATERSLDPSSLAPRAARHYDGPTIFRRFDNRAQACRKNWRRGSGLAAQTAVGLGDLRACRRQDEADGFPLPKRSGGASRGGSAEDPGRSRGRTGRRSWAARTPPSGQRLADGGALLRGRLVEGGAPDDNALEPREDLPGVS